jgi:hypothetical protein
MSSQQPISASSVVPVDTKVWDMIFVDAKVKKDKKKATEDTQPIAPITAANIDIRDWVFDDRKLLVSKGDRVNISIDDKILTTMSKPLFRATSSTARDLLQAGTVNLPADTDKDSVTRLVNYLESLIANTAKPTPFTRSLNISASLSVCTAASTLGMAKYVDHVYKKCEYHLRMDPPTYADIDAITAHKTAHERLFRIVATSLAVRVWDDTIPDPEDFYAYLAQNSILDAAITTANEKHADHVRRMEVKERRRVQQEQSQARYEASAKAKAEREAKKLADETVYFAAKVDKEAALEKSVQKKMRASEPKERKFTPEETAHYRRRYGKNPPKGC